MNKDIKQKKKRRMMNRKLCKRYPFIAIRDWKTGKPLKEWKYAFTELDNLPYGWRKAFGYQMLEEIRDILKQLFFRLSRLFQ